MTLTLPSQAIAHSFSGVARTYDQWARPQRHAAEGLMARLPHRTYNSIYEIGCGTGILSELLLKKNGETAFLGIDVATEMVKLCQQKWPEQPNSIFKVADGEKFVPEEKYDLIASSFCFQWFNARAESIQRLSYFLKPGGILATSVPIAGTLAELQNCYREVTEEELPGLDYGLVEDYQKAVESAGLKVSLVEPETHQLLLPDGLEVLRSLKGMGASFKHFPDYEPLPSSKLRRLVSLYEKKYGLPDGVPATYEILYLVGEKA